MLVVPFGGEATILEAILGIADRFKLFVNDIEPSGGDVEGDYVEAVGAGYPDGGVVLNPPDWVIDERVGDTALSGAIAHYPQINFAFTGSVGTVHGYYVVDRGGSLLWAERLEEPHYLTSKNFELRLTPSFQFSSATQGSNQ